MFLFSLEVEDLWKIFDRNRVQVKKCRKSFGDTASRGIFKFYTSHVLQSRNHNIDT